jgi:hypothetical protein
MGGGDQQHKQAEDSIEVGNISHGLERWLRERRPDAQVFMLGCEAT